VICFRDRRKKKGLLFRGGDGFAPNTIGRELGGRKKDHIAQQERRRRGKAILPSREESENLCHEEEVKENASDRKGGNSCDAGRKRRGGKKGRTYQIPV